MISPEIWDSQNFSQLSDLAKIVFISLISHADDEGRGKAHPTRIKSSTFPYDEGRRVADIKSALSEIARRMSVQFYSVNGIEYYFLTNWGKWQKIDKPSQSKLPPPPMVGEGGDIPDCEKFDEDSPKVRRTFGEASATNRIERNRIEVNIRGGSSNYGLHKLVTLTETEYGRLREEIGEAALKDYINRLDSWLTKKPVSGSHANVILKWYNQDAKDRPKGAGQTVGAADLNALFGDVTEENI